MATVEYTAVAFVVSAALAVGAGAVDARAIPDAVGMQLRRAYCLVAGGDCLGRDGPRPCVVRSTSRGRELRATIVLVRLRDGRVAVREELSDGTFRITVRQGSGAGVGATFGADLQVGRRRVRAGGEAQGGGDAALERTFLAPDRAAADRLLERLAGDGPPVGGALAGLVRFARDPASGSPGEVTRTVSVSTRAEAEAALRALGHGPDATAMGGVTGGVRVDHRTGARTLLLRFPREVTATLSAPLLDVDVDAGGSGSTDVELTLDRRRDPVELLVRVRRAARGAAKVDGARARGGTLVEGELRLDLADPGVRDLASRLARGDTGAARPLADRLAAGARIDLRRYTTTRAGSEKGAQIKAGGGLGGQIATTTDTATLVAARGREPGLGWADRLDCLHPA